MKRGPKVKPAYERFWAKVERTPGCWLWRGAVSDTKYPYGSFWDGRQIAAHRMSLLLDGQDPTGREVDHLCGVSLCVRPSHLEIVDQAENKRRQGKARTAKNRCRQGHEFTPENTYTPPTGRRECRTCKAARR